MSPATRAVVVDARGLKCPQPVIVLARAARDRSPGDRITVLSDDPAALADVPAWARLKGHAIEAVDAVEAVGEHPAYVVHHLVIGGGALT